MTTLRDQMRQVDALLQEAEAALSLMFSDPSQGLTQARAVRERVQMLSSLLMR